MEKFAENLNLGKRVLPPCQKSKMLERPHRPQKITEYTL